MNEGEREGGSWMLVVKVCVKKHCIKKDFPSMRQSGDLWAIVGFKRWFTSEGEEANMQEVKIWMC